MRGRQTHSNSCGRSGECRRGGRDPRPQPFRSMRLPSTPPVQDQAHLLTLGQSYHYSTLSPLWSGARPRAQGQGPQAAPMGAQLRKGWAARGTAVAEVGAHDRAECRPGRGHQTNTTREEVTHLAQAQGGEGGVGTPGRGPSRHRLCCDQGEARRSPHNGGWGSAHPKPQPVLRRPQL